MHMHTWTYRYICHCDRDQLDIRMTQDREILKKGESESDEWENVDVKPVGDFEVFEYRQRYF